MIPPSSSPLHPLIRKLESIATLTDDEKQAVTSLPARSRTLEPRQEIVRDGDRPSQCCLLVEGWLYRSKTLGDGKRQILALHVPGDMPDLHSLHLPVLDHTLATLTRAIVAFIPHENMHELVTAHPGIAAALWRDTLIDAAIFREWITGLGRRDARARIAHLFCEMYVKLHAVGLAADQCCEFPLTQAEMSDALGLSTVHVNRTVQELRAEQLISWSGRSLQILDWTGLVAAGEFDPTYLHVQKRAAS
ncbi:Crp/Fnr family transcriptional regulator [Methylobacterium oryzisoli]|uniref:Crp/Fnr family transcriptional regulator n=1 Tax=Methylobacterium oryzisoli TaxID=3385502 RepID=UPI00389201ED